MALKGKRASPSWQYPLSGTWIKGSPSQLPIGCIWTSWCSLHVSSRQLSLELIPRHCMSVPKAPVPDSQHSLGVSAPLPGQTALLCLGMTGRCTLRMEASAHCVRAQTPAELSAATRAAFLQEKLGIQSMGAEFQGSTPKARADHSCPPVPSSSPLRPSSISGRVAADCDSFRGTENGRRGDLCRQATPGQSLPCHSVRKAQKRSGPAPCQRVAV